jgi:hypothetical protein
MRHQSQKRAGYVLVLTLGIIALASITLAGLARHSMRLAANANQSAEELQRRWGLLSVRHVLLERAGEILEMQVPDEQAGTPPWPKPSWMTADFQLGDQIFSVVVADEDSKLNLNAVYQRKRDRIRSAIRNVENANSGALPDVRPMPNRDEGTPFSSLGQVFDLSRTSTDQVGAMVATLGQELTCWGSGRLNVRRCSDAVLRETASLVLPAKEVGEILQERRSWGGQNVEQLLDPLGLRRPKYLAVRRLLDAGSRSYSLWVNIDDGQRERMFAYIDNGWSTSFAW